MALPASLVQGEQVRQVELQRFFGGGADLNLVLVAKPALTLAQLLAEVAAAARHIGVPIEPAEVDPWGLDALLLDAGVALARRAQQLPPPACVDVDVVEVEHVTVEVAFMDAAIAAVATASSSSGRAAGPKRSPQVAPAKRIARGRRCASSTRGNTPARSPSSRRTTAISADIDSGRCSHQLRNHSGVMKALPRSSASARHSSSIGANPAGSVISSGFTVVCFSPFGPGRDSVAEPGIAGAVTEVQRRRSASIVRLRCQR